MLKGIKYLTGIAIILAVISCCPQKNIEKTSDSATPANQAKKSPEYKMDSTEIAYTEKLMNDPGITDTKGSLTTEELSQLLPAPYGEFKSRPLSSSKMDDDGSIVVVVKGQYYGTDNTIVTVDITDFSPQRKVLKPEIYDTNIPVIQNFETTPMTDRGGKGYITWNPVKSMGWLSILYAGRFNVKIRVHGPSASKELMLEFLSKTDTRLFKAQ